VTEEKKPVVYIMVPKKLVYTWLSTTLLLFALVGASFQYTNWVDRKSNGLWCGIVNLFNDTYQKSPPPSTAGQILANEFIRLRKGFHCN
jgi:hypothetical protein